MVKSVIQICFACLIASSCYQNRTQSELANFFHANKPTLDSIVKSLQYDKKLDSIFQIIPDSRIPDIKNSYPDFYNMLTKVGIIHVSSHLNVYPKKNSWYYFKTDWSSDYPIYVIYNAYDSVETKLGYYSKDEVSNETFGLGDKWKMFRFVKYKRYKQ